MQRYLTNRTFGIVILLNVIRTSSRKKFSAKSALKTVKYFIEES